MKRANQLLLALLFAVTIGNVYAQSTITDRIGGVSAALAIKAPVRAATTVNITLSGEQTIDGIAVVTGDRVLVKNQTTSTANGIYTADSGTWVRALDFDGNRDVAKGTQVLVTDGSVNANTYWRVSTANPITIDTSAITFERATVDDAATLTFLQSGTGAVSSDVQTVLRSRAYSVMDFMTAAQIADVQAGTLLQDVTTAIQTAWTAAKAAGRCLDFPDGYYLISDTAITINYADTKACVTGNHQRSVIMNRAGASKPTIKLFGAQVWSISGLVLAGTAGYPNIGIQMIKDGSGNRVAYGVLDKLVINSNGVGIDIQDTNTIAISNYTYWNGASYGATADSNGNTNGIYAHGTSAVNSVQVRNIIVGAVPTVANGGTAIKVDGSASIAGFQDWSIDGAELEQAAVATYRSLYLNHVEGFRVRTAFTENSHFLVLASRYVDVQVSGGATWSITLGDGTAPNANARVTVRDSNGDTLTADSNNSEIHCYNSIFAVGGYNNSATRSVTLSCRTTASAAVVDKLGAEGIKERDRTTAIGEWTTPTFDAANFTGFGALTVTVASGDVTTQEYTLIGKTMIYNVVLVTVSTGGTADVAIKVKIPGSFTANKTVRVPCIINNAGGGRTVGLAEVQAAGTFVFVYVDPTLVTNWSNAAANTTALEFSIAFEVQ